MDDGRDPVLFENAVDECAISQIAFGERSPLGRPSVPVDEVVEHDRFETRLGDQLGGMAADVPSAARDQHRHDFSPFLLRTGLPP